MKDNFTFLEGDTDSIKFMDKTDMYEAFQTENQI